MDETEFDKDVSLDLNYLEWECARQSQLVAKWGKRYSLACRRRNRLDEKVKTERSDLIEEVRLRYAEYGFTREPTQQHVEAFYRRDKNYKEAKRKFLKAENDATMLWIATRALEHKREMLGIEQRLYAQEFFDVPYKSPQFVDKIEKETRGDHLDQLGEEDHSRLKKRSLKGEKNGKN